MSDQLGLFAPVRHGDQPTRPVTSALPPIAARTDPPTSAKAAAELTRSGARQRQIDRVVELVRQWPGSTSFELAVKGGVDRHLVGRRLPDARAAGLVANGPARRCGVTGKLAVTWTPAGGVGGARGGR